jgi:beta-glucosidase
MSWDYEVIKEAGSIVGKEMEEFGATLWLAPGMNIHRNPLCGRNFEYYSEDPLISGMCAAADTEGIQSHAGVGTTIKHFAVNNQEDNRNFNNSHVSERALREIYLKGFEIAVKKSQPMSIMSSYNLLNGTHTANNYDLLTLAARDEWGFTGVVMTDWGTTGHMGFEDNNLKKYPCSSPAMCIKAGNDLIMPGSKEDIEDIIASVDATEGKVPYPITLADLQFCTKNMLKLIMQTSCYENSKPYSNQFTLEQFVDVK